jgi:ubiquinone/menaquinone biosynthesis C-methylase UbiE
MVRLARRRGFQVVMGVGEALPYASGRFDFALMVTTLCFLNDVLEAFGEIRRILKPHGALVIGFVDRDSLVGRYYESHRDQSVFYRVARFYSTAEVVQLLTCAGFCSYQFRQTIFSLPGEVSVDERVEEGYGRGSFIAVKARI